MVGFGTQSICRPMARGPLRRHPLRLYSRKRYAFSNLQHRQSRTPWPRTRPTRSRTPAPTSANAVAAGIRKRCWRSPPRRPPAWMSQGHASRICHRPLRGGRRGVSQRRAPAAQLAAFEIVADVTAPDWDFADDPGDLDPISNYPSYQRVLTSQGAFVVAVATEHRPRWTSSRPTRRASTYVLRHFGSTTNVWVHRHYDRRPGPVRR